jgi:cystathionine gamma-synthase/methionine-gamma-lyase
VTALTKYCGGHSDLLAGSVSGGEDLIARLRSLRMPLGNHMPAFTAWLLLRSLETLGVRTERALANAADIAAFLGAQPKVETVTWLGALAPGSAARAVYDRQCRGPGSTFSFQIRGGEAEAFRLLDRLEVMKLAVSLGGTETLICHPATTTHFNVPEKERRAGGITPATLRLSVGLEHAGDLIADLRRGLEAV